MVTMQSWMFLSSFEVMRKKILNSYDLVCLMHMENMVMGIAFGTAVSIFKTNKIKGFKGTYNQIKLNDIENEAPKQFPNYNNRHSEISSDNFAKIPGMPVAYWLSNNAYNDFKYPKINQYLECKSGIMAGSNDYIRLWMEVNINSIKFDCKNAEDMHEFKWFPLNSGGDYRKYYGNLTKVIDLWHDGKDIRDNVKNYRLREKSYYFKSGITWGRITSSDIAFRLAPEGTLFGDAGPVGFAKANKDYLLGLLSSKVSKYFLQAINPTLNYQVHDIESIPVAFEKNNKIDNDVEACINLSKSDWNSFETSWDFKRHPLLPDFDNHFTKISDAYNHWKDECDTRFNQLKSNEEELNRIFIDIYGLQDELTPEEDDSDVTVSKADLTRDIKSLISYAVGCMFGRYSLDKEGLVYAGGDFDSVYWKYKGFAPMNQDGSYPLGSGYTGLGLAEYHYPKFRDDYDPENATTLSFEPDVDNVIPITDEKYLDDDIVQRFCDWISVVYGKDTLEENLDFVAKALGNKDKTSRECIREYFLNDFFKDHCSTYSVTGSGKRPIYWLFDSGKQNAFKALVYMHRWDENTIGRVRIYSHEIQSKYETEMKNIEAFIDQSTDHRQIARDEKRLDHLKKQITEIKDYDEKLEHLASEHIAIDLDDGVKVNYEKVQTDRNGKKFQILAQIR